MPLRSKMKCYFGCLDNGLNYAAHIEIDQPQLLSGIVPPSSMNNMIKLESVSYRIICDQARTNVNALKNLHQDTREKYLKEGHGDYIEKAIEIGGKKIFPLFDPPHLLKGVRNNLLIKDALFVQDGVMKRAKWDHIRMLLDVDDGDDEIRLVNKLTEAHVIKEKIPKMKVKFAAQIFSQRVSSAMRFLAKHKILPEECSQTADFLLIFDKLFDSFNGHSYQNSPKQYKNCLKRNSPHFNLWHDLLPILESIKFESVVIKNNVVNIKHESIPSIQNWIHNIKVFKELWHHLNQYHNICNLLTRNFNQDPLENFFSSIRSNGFRNINPNCSQFISAFKTLLINNFSSPHSLGANCEKDNNNPMKIFTKFFNQKSDDIPKIDYSFDIDHLILVVGQLKSSDCLIYAESKKYVSGYIIKKCKSKIFTGCTACMHDLAENNLDINSFIYEIDYTKKSLFHPNHNFINLMNNIYYTIVACLRLSPESSFLKHKIAVALNLACDYSFITCKEHKTKLINFINDLAIRLIIYSWCTGVNRILHGKISKFDKNDLVKVQAFDYYNKKYKK